MADAQLWEVKLECIDETHQSLFENLMANKYGHV